MLASIGRPYNSTKGRDGGGLGLFLVVNVVRKLGGRVDVKNRTARGAMVRWKSRWPRSPIAGEG
jgi:two-component system sensor histidine kinase RegB